MVDVPEETKPLIVAGGAGVTVQLKVVPDTFELRVTNVELFPEQTD